MAGQNQELENFLKKPFPPEGRTLLKLPARTELHLEHDTAFLTVYRRRKNDPGTAKLARSCHAYLIIGEASPKTERLLTHIAQSMSNRFGTFLILEIETGSQDEFLLTGPANRLAPEFDDFTEKLKKIPHRGPNQPWKIRTESAPETFPKAVLVRLKIPPAYQGSDGGVYPVYLRKFRQKFAAAVQRFAFEFLRLQTTSGITTFDSLGKRSISETSLEIDHNLAEIAESYRFLLLVAPTNLAEIETEFFSSKFTKVPPYRYRLLPVDPDLLKRDLFNLRLEDIDDPAMSFLFSEKREELDHELTMLSERGTKNFFYSSIRRYRGVHPETLQTARTILREVPPEKSKTPANQKITALEFAAHAEEEFTYFQSLNPDFTSKIHIREDLNTLMVSRGELYIPASQKLSPRQVRALTQHEVGTHVLTYFNGTRQPLRLLADGLADYDPLQEGLAVIAEFFADALSPARLRTLAGRVIAGECLLEGADFQETFHALHKTWKIPPRQAFTITARMFQGGGFLKDIIYLEGLVKLRVHLMDGGKLEPLFAGKFGLKHIPLVAELTTRGILSPPALLPRYLNQPGFAEKLAAVREGLPIHKMSS